MNRTVAGAMLFQAMTLLILLTIDCHDRNSEMQATIVLGMLYVIALVVGGFLVTRKTRYFAAQAAVLLFLLMSSHR